MIMHFHNFLSIILAGALFATHNMTSIHAAFTAGGSLRQPMGTKNINVAPLSLVAHGQTIKSKSCLSLTGSIMRSGSSSRLFAENPGEAESTQEPTEASSAQEDDEKTTKEEPAPSASSSSSANDKMNDILDSPAFLKRKIDVLKSDIEAADEKIEAANKIYEANKAEWGPQLETLRKEVSTWWIVVFFTIGHGLLKRL